MVSISNYLNSFHDAIERQVTKIVSWKGHELTALDNQSSNAKAGMLNKIKSVYDPIKFGFNELSNTLPDLNFFAETYRVPVHDTQDPIHKDKNVEFLSLEDAELLSLKENIQLRITIIHAMFLSLNPFN